MRDMSQSDRERILEAREDAEDIREGLKALADDKGTITLEEYQRRRKKQELKSKNETGRGGQT